MWNILVMSWRMVNSIPDWGQERGIILGLWAVRIWLELTLCLMIYSRKEIMIVANTTIILCLCLLPRQHIRIRAWKEEQCAKYSGHLAGLKGWHSCVGWRIICWLMVSIGLFPMPFQKRNFPIRTVHLIFMRMGIILSIVICMSYLIIWTGSVICWTVDGP